MVSVIVPTYNRARLVERAVRSALAQTLASLEVIVVDDGSTDNTLEVLGVIADPRLRVIEGDHAGAPAARNRGLAVARGEWLLFLDSDDLLGAEHLDVLLGRGDRSPDVGVVYTGYTIVDEADGTRTAHPPHHVADEHMALGYFNLLGGSSAGVYRATTVRAVGGWDPALPARQDTDLLLRVSAVSRFVVASERTDTLFVHHGAQDRISANAVNRRNGFEQFLSKHGSSLPLHTRIYLSKRLLALGLATRHPRTVFRSLPLGALGAVARVRPPTDV
jgi:glycosyltransferase involved in cell wall biosynthesis